MREILFRGKRLDNGEWLESKTLVHAEDLVFLGANVWVQGNYGNPGGITHLSSDTPFLVLVDPDTVGQYTGMKDKHGNKIFEGDKLRFVEPEEACEGVMKVIWYGGGWCTKEDGSYPDRLEDGDTEDMEIIGNVWEG